MYLTLFLILSFIIGIYYLIKTKAQESSFLMFVVSMITIFLLDFNNKLIEIDEKVPKRSFIVVDKIKYNQCNKETSCQEIYNLYLKTDNGFSFKETFDYNTYENSRIGSKITYKQTYKRYLETGGKPFSNEE